MKLLKLVAEKLPQKRVHLHTALVHGRGRVLGHDVDYGRRDGLGRLHEVQVLGHLVGAGAHFGGVAHLRAAGYQLRLVRFFEQLIAAHGHAAAQNGGA